MDEERDCSAILQQIAASRGAISGLMSKAIQGHIREHVIDPRSKPTSERAEAAEELIDALKTF